MTVVPTLPPDKCTEHCVTQGKGLKRLGFSAPQLKAGVN